MKIPGRARVVTVASAASLVCGTMLWWRVHSGIAAPSADHRPRIVPALETTATATSVSVPASLTVPLRSRPTSAAPALAPDDAAALTHAKSLQREGKFGQSKAAFIQATGRGESVNLLPLAEYAYALLAQQDETTFDDVEAMLLTSTKDADLQLQAQAWYNLALLYQKRNAPEAERAALARSLVRREHWEARARIEGRSGCVAEIGTRYATAEVKITTGWRGVCLALELCKKGEFLTRTKARERVCGTAAAAAGLRPGSHRCTGNGPWESSFGPSPHRSTKAWLEPLTRDRFFIVKSSEGGLLAKCQGTRSTSSRRSGDYVVVSQQYQPMSALPGRPTPETMERDSVCLQMPELTTTEIFSITSTKLLAAVTVVAGHPVPLSLNSAERRLKLYGGGCDGHIPVDGSMRLVSSRGN